VHLNPVGVDRCQKCGTWISPDPEPPLSASSSPAVSAQTSPEAEQAEIPVDVMPLAESQTPLDREVRALMERGQKIEAIRLYRERTGADLKRAKDYVEKFGRGAAVVGDKFEERILALLRTGQKILAIKEFRERTGVSLKEAKDYVEALGLRHGIKPANVGCGTTALLLGVAVGLIYWASRLL
jgi:ribosomal protein L7/L12